MKFLSISLLRKAKCIVISVAGYERFCVLTIYIKVYNSVLNVFLIVYFLFLYNHFNKNGEFSNSM